MHTSQEISQRAVGVEDAFGSLGIRRTAFYSLVRAGKIRVIKLGRRTLVPCSELDRVVAEGLAEANSVATE